MNIDEVNIPKSADQEFSITCKDADGVLLDLSTASQILIVLFFEDNTLLQKYARDIGSGWTEAIDDSLAASGELRIKVDGGYTASAQSGKVYYELRIIYTDGTYSDGTDDKVIEKKYLFTLVESITNGMTWPS